MADGPFSALAEKVPAQKQSIAECGEIYFDNAFAATL